MCGAATLLRLIESAAQMFRELCHTLRREPQEQLVPDQLKLHQRCSSSPFDEIDTRVQCVSWSGGKCCIRNIKLTHCGLVRLNRAAMVILYAIISGRRLLANCV